MIKNECKIVRDLFPNYIEELLSNETKNFVENHINNCNQCKELLELVKEEKTKEIDKRHNEEIYEINYLKKFRRKLLTLKSIIILFIIIIIIASASYLIKFSYTQYILDSAYKKLQEIENSENFKLSIENYNINYETEGNDEQFFNTTYYYKDGKYKEEMSGRITNGTLIYANRAYYGEINSNKRTEIYIDEKEIINKTANYNLLTKQGMFDTYNYTKDYGQNYGTILNLIVKGGLRVKTETYNGKECYVITFSNDNKDCTAIWIEKESMMVLKETSGEVGRYYYETKYIIEKDIVTDEDIAMPQLEGYIEKDEEVTAKQSFMIEYHNNH